jgi:RNA polymerase-binding transcription factor DksA
MAVKSDESAWAADYWTPEKLAAVDARLLALQRDLRRDIARELRKYADDQYGVLAANVADSAELAVADLLVDLDLAEIDRDAGELADVESARQRVVGRVYGICIDCGAWIEPARLEVTPHAPRCIPCQERIEARRHVGHTLKL